MIPYILNIYLILYSKKITIYNLKKIIYNVIYHELYHILLIDTWYNLSIIIGLIWLTSIYLMFYFKTYSSTKKRNKRVHNK